MSFATEIKKLSAFLNEQGFLTVPQNVVRGMRSWVKELDGENLVYLYICVKQHDGSSQSGHLIVSPPRNNDDGWERTALAFGIPLDENWDLETGFFDKYINRINNLLPSAACLKDAVINEMRNPGEIATAGINTARERPCAKCAYSKHSINYDNRKIFPNCAESAKTPGLSKKRFTTSMPNPRKNI